MKILIKLDKRTANKDNKFPVKYYFSHNKEQFYVATGLFATESEFNEIDLFSLKDPKTRNENRRNNLILSEKLEQANTLLYNLSQRGKNVSPKQFSELLFNRRETISFYEFYEEYLSRKTGSTKEVYQCTLNKLRKMYKQLYFEDIDYRFLVGFESKCIENGNRTNTIGIDMRNIRAVYNEAMKMKMVSRDLYPFTDFKIKKEETAHRVLAEEQLRKIFEYQGTESENYARDCAKLIFLLIGINTSDLYDLKKPENGCISYRRDKTGKLYQIKVEPEMLPLFEQFKGVNSFLCFSEQFSSVHELTKKINGSTVNQKKFIKKDNTFKNYLIEKKGLNTISKALGLEKVTSYYMRHTWGTLAGELDIPKETISKALGHGKKDVTDIYVRFNQKKIDEANRKIIDLVFCK